MLDIGVYRSTSNKWIFGVCAGIGRRFGIDPMWVRIGTLALVVLPAGLGIFPVGLFYLILTALLPKEPAI